MHKRPMILSSLKMVRLSFLTTLLDRPHAKRSHLFIYNVRPRNTLKFMAPIITTADAHA